MDKPETLDKKAVEAHRKQATEAVTRAVDPGPRPTPERLHGTLKGLLSVAAVVYLKLRGVPVNRRLVDAAATAAAVAIREAVEADET